LNNHSNMSANKEYHIKEGENYFPENHTLDIKCDIAGGLHELLFVTKS